MVSALSFFAISVVAILVLLLSGRFLEEKPTIFQRSDEMIIRWLRQARVISLFANKKTIGLLIHYLLELTEKFFNKLFEKLKNLVKK